jgi:opacity protein-like surface antigen
MQRALARVAAVAVIVMGMAVSGYAQQVEPARMGTVEPASNTTRWNGFFVSGTLGVWPRSVDLGASTERIQQVTGVTVGNTVVNVPPTTQPIPAISPSGWPLLGGIYGGYQRQYGSVVVGGEGGIDFAFGAISNTSAVQLPATALTPSAPLTMERRASTQWGWSVRGRGGYVWNDVLVYGLAGAAMASVKLEAVDTWSSPGGGGTGNIINLGPLGPYVTTAADTQHKMAFTFGFGAEKAIGYAWSIGGEFRYTAYPTVNFGLSNPSVAINGPLPSSGVNAAAYPGAMSLKIVDYRIGVRATMRLNFGQ